MEVRGLHGALSRRVGDDPLLRHAAATRLLHGVDALVVAILLVTGLALGDVIPDGVAALLGGHLRINAVHRLLGVALAAGLLAIVVSVPRRVARWLRDVAHMHRADWRWPLDFLRFFIRPRQHTPPFHAGRFDPAQRIVFLGIFVALAATSASGVYLYFWTPAFPLGQLSMAYAVRIHIAAAWLLIACLGLHIIAGSGLLWTHRGIAAAMFGNGKITAKTAHKLWPGWARAAERAKRQR